jgi:hypothetical protein
VDRAMAAAVQPGSAAPRLRVPAASTGSAPVVAIGFRSAPPRGNDPGTNTESGITTGGRSWTPDYQKADDELRRRDAKDARTIAIIATAVAVLSLLSR